MASRCWAPLSSTSKERTFARQPMSSDGDLRFQMNPQLPARVPPCQTLSRGPSEAMHRLLIPQKPCNHKWVLFNASKFCGNMLRSNRIWKQEIWTHVAERICGKQSSQGSVFSRPWKFQPSHTQMLEHISVYLFPGQLGPESVASRSLLSTPCNLPGFTWCTGVWMAGGKMLALSTKWAQLEASGSPALTTSPLCLENGSSHSLFKECS